MLHVSTRGEAPALGFSDALLAGLARDGGLYLPESWPALSAGTIRSFSGMSYAEVAKAVLTPLVDGDIPDTDLHRMIDEAYADFRHPAVCPLVQLDDNLFVLELFHGPTLAFKDVAMQLLGRLMDYVLRTRGTRATIVGATSGDTGSAAVEAFKGLEQVDIFILYPHGRVSDVQRRQMTTIASPNVHALAIEGTFDDCQSMVKGMFNHARFRDELHLSGVNSINWARIAAQVVYYFTAAVALGAPDRRVSFSVPTGNFGDILAGWVAKRMGLPIQRLMIATNANDILARTLETGTYEIKACSPRTRRPWTFKSRPISSVCCSRRMSGMRAPCELPWPDFPNPGPSPWQRPLARIQDEFTARAVDEEGVADEMARTYRATGYVLDPHSAVGTRAGRALLQSDPATPVIALSTAHPAKFPGCGPTGDGNSPTSASAHGGSDGPDGELHGLPHDQKAVEAFIRDRARAASGIAA